MLALVRKEGTEAYVNPQTAGVQKTPVVTALPGGGYVVVWADESSDGDSDGFGIMAQLYDPAGAKIGDGFLVNSFTSAAQTEPSVALLASGGFVVTWTTDEDEIQLGGDGSATAIKGQIFTAAGDKSGGEFLANSNDHWVQDDSYVFALPNGGFVVAWHDGSTFDVRAQVFDAAGTKVGGEILVSNAEQGIQSLPTGVAFGEDRFVIMWTNYNFNSQQSLDVTGQIFDLAGTKIGDEFRVSTVTEHIQNAPDVAALAGGGFVAVWQGQEATGNSIKAQIFDPEGAKVGGEVVASTINNNPDSASVTALDWGGFLVAWENFDGNVFSERGRVIDGQGNKIGLEFQINTEPGVWGARVDVAALASGEVVAVWMNENGANAEQMGIKAQRLLLPTAGTDGADVLYGTEGDDAIAGLSGGDQLFGEGGSDLIEGNGGNDLLDGGAGADAMAGGAGNDVYWVDDSSDSVLENAGEGSDEIRTTLASLTLGAEVENLTGLSAAGQALTGNGVANLITGASGDDTIEGGAGNDLLDGGAGADTMRGGVGSDTYVVDDSADVVEENFGEGSDAVRTALAVYSLAARPNVENIVGTSSTGQVLTGNAGGNRIEGGSGNDILHLWSGGNDSALGHAGNDTFFFGAALTAADTIRGGAGSDIVVIQGGYSAGLTLTANVSDIEGISILGGGNTSLGEPGTNRYDYVLTTHDSNFAAGVQARINGSALLEGEDFTFNGSAETDASYVVYGGRGKDSLTGGLGADIFFFAEERFASGDTVNGGAGYDGMFLRGNYTIDFNAPGYTGLFTNIENLTLTSATDERYARGGGTEFDYNLTLSDAIVGAGQELTVSGTILLATETMVLDGSQETDGRLRLFGGKASDILKGGGQADLLHGNLGADLLSGGGGADAFRYQNAAESNSGGTDQILDFTPGTDKIELDRIDANSLAAGNQAFSWIGSNAFSGSAGELRAFQSGAEWIVEGDINGDGTADLVIALTLQGPTPLGAGDFLL